MSTEPLLMQASSTDYQMNATTANLLRNAILLQQATMQRTASPAPQTQQDEPQEHINEGITEKENLDAGRDALASPSPDPDTYSLPYGTFRRYNSLRIRKDVSSTTTGCLPRRTLSMRLPKSKKKNGNISSHAGSAGVDQMAKRADVADSFQNLDASQSSTVNKQLLSRRRKHKLFLSRLLSFRGVRKISGRKDKAVRNANNTIATKGQPIARNDKSSDELISVGNSNGERHEDNKKTVISTTSPPTGRNASVEKQQSTNKVATASTQTSFSLEHVNADLAFLSLAEASKNSTLDREDSDSGRCTDSHSDADAEITAALNRDLTPTMHDHRHHLHLHSHAHDSRRRDLVGRSHSSCNVYEKIESDLGLKVDVDVCDGRSPRSPSSQMSISPSPSTFTTASAMYNRACNKHQLHSRCHSSASSSGYSYRDFYNMYRRRYPSYQQSTPTSLESAEINEGLRFRPQLPIRYPPRTFERKQIFDEISRGSFKEKKQSRNNKTVPILCNSSNGNDSVNNGKLSRAGHHDVSVENAIAGNTDSNDNGNSIQSEEVNEPIKSNATTTTTTTTKSTGQGQMTTILSQTLKNTTNLELEFHLPLGNIFNTALANAGKNAQTSSTSNEQLRSERLSTNESGSHKPGMRERECTLSEVNTMVNDLFTIKSFVKSNPLNDELSSTIEFKTRGNHVGGSSGCSKNINNNHNANNSSKTTYRIEAVSSKPFADIHTKFNRESEII